nr:MULTISPECIES: CidA/LrgA family protein [Shewanella]
MPASYVSNESDKNSRFTKEGRATDCVVKSNGKLRVMLQTLAQVGLFSLLAVICVQAEQYFDLPIPGSVIGLAIVLFLLLTKAIPERSVSLGSAWLIGELLLFFIPPVVSVIKYQSLFEHYGVRLIVMLVLGTVFVLVGTGFVVDRVFRFERRMNRQRAQALLAPSMEG